MLPQFFRIFAVNNSGQTVNFDTGLVNLKVTGIFVDPATGLLDYTPLPDDDMSFDGNEDWLDGGELKSDEITNTVTKYLAVHVQLEITHDAGNAAIGRFDLFLDGGDATGELRSDAAGYTSAEIDRLSQVGSLNWPAEASDDDKIRSAVFTV